MRLVLHKSKQKELIELAKGNLTWEKLANKVGCNSDYLSRDLRYGKIFLSDNFYKILCELANKDFNNFILEEKEDNWGQSKGGINSPGSLKILPEIKFDEKLAEFVGAVLGDGHIEFFKRGKKIGVYHVRIAGDLEKDKDYHLNYLRPLGKKLFNLDGKEILRIKEKNNGRSLTFSSRNLVEFFLSMGIKPGDKIRNQSTIPKWVFQDKKFLQACVRGLIDTDGSIARMSQRDYNLLRILFTNHNKTLLGDTRRAFIELGFHPSKLMNNRQFYLSRQVEIERYIKEIGFSNKKHKDRFIRFRVPSSSGQG